MWLRRITPTLHIPKFRVIQRRYGVRGEFDSPLDYLPKHNPKKPFINWKVTLGFIVVGSYLSYSELILDKYAEYTEFEALNPMLPIQLSYKLTQLPIYEQLTRKHGDDWIKLETWEDLNHNIFDQKDFTHKDKQLTAQAQGTDDDNTTMISHTLAKPGGFLIKPVIFHNQQNQGVTIVHAGYRLCGYPFIVHGGIIATILNETFKRNAALCNETTSSYKGDFKVENLSISYKSPTFANQFLIVKTKKVPMEGESGKLIKLQSTIESENGTILVNSEAILHDTGLISNRSSLRHYMGL